MIRKIVNIRGANVKGFLNEQISSVSLYSVFNVNALYRVLK